MKKTIMFIVMISIIFGSTLVAFALPEGVVVLGNKAFSVYLLGDKDYEDDINQAINDADGFLYYRLYDDDYISIYDESVMTSSEREKVRQIKFIDEDKQVWTYKSIDDKSPAKEDVDFEIVDIH